MKDFDIHDICNLFPKMTESEFTALKEDIRTNGVAVPLLICNGKVIDGRHRWLAVKELRAEGLEIDCPIEECRDTSLWLKVQSRNLRRRHLDAATIALIIQMAAEQFPELKQLIEDETDAAKSRMKDGTLVSRGTRVADELGAKFGVSGSSWYRAQRLLRDVPERVHEVLDGKMSVVEVLAETLSEKPRDDGHPVDGYSEEVAVAARCICEAAMEFVDSLPDRNVPQAVECLEEVATIFGNAQNEFAALHLQCQRKCGEFLKTMEQDEALADKPFSGAEAKTVTKEVREYEKRARNILERVFHDLDNAVTNYYAACGTEAVV